MKGKQDEETGGMSSELAMAGLHGGSRRRSNKEPDTDSITIRRRRDRGEPHRADDATEAPRVWSERRRELDGDGGGGRAAATRIFQTS